MKYITYLKNKNLSKETIRIYLIYSDKWLMYLDGRKPTKTLFVKYINQLSKTHKPNSIKLQYASILSYIKYQKNWKLYMDFQDIKLPKQDHINREIISVEEFNYLKKKIKIKTWHQKRNWVVFCFLFTTGIRISELMTINLNEINQNKIEIKCKGSLHRTVFISDYLNEILKLNKRGKLCTSKKGKSLSHNQIIKIIRKIGIDYLNKNITPHTLRRSYATNLLRKNIDIKTVSKLMGHKNINTTSKYIYLTENEMFEKIKYIFD